MHTREWTRAVIRIQYRDLPSGVHARAARAGRSTTIYLRPGLTGAQRKAALRRLRQEARMRCGPSLPRGPLAVARGADWAERAVRQLAAIVRLHPVGILVSAVLLTVMAALLLHASAQAASREQGIQGPAAGAAAAELATMPTLRAVVRASR
jgi:hypothetical protein